MRQLAVVTGYNFRRRLQFFDVFWCTRPSWKSGGLVGYSFLTVRLQFFERSVQRYFLNFSCCFLPYIHSSLSASINLINSLLYPIQLKVSSKVLT